MQKTPCRREVAGKTTRKSSLGGLRVLFRGGTDGSNFRLSPFTTQEQKQQYIRQYKQKEGIDLQNVAKNPGRKQVAKLMLNSFWGKFGQRENLPQVQQCQELYNITEDDTNQVQELRFCTEDVLEVVYKNKALSLPLRSGTRTTFTGTRQGNEEEGVKQWLDF